MNRFWQIVKKAPAKLAILLIRCYQLAVSPLFPSSCRFEPTCSQYGIMAFQKYGFLKGMALTTKRIARCHPGGAYGYDPVP